MSNTMTPSQQHTIRIAYENISTVINVLILIEGHSGTDDLAAASILLCRRQIANISNSLSEQFGANWPENQ